jgi:hypothetical protein
MDITAKVVVPTGDGPGYKTTIVDQAGTPASFVTGCRATMYSPDSTLYGDYRGNGTYSLIVYEYRTDTCTGTPTQRVFRYAIGAGTAIIAPGTRFLTRDPNSFVLRHYNFGVNLNPGTSLYDINYALGGVVGPDGAISGPSRPAFVDTSTGLADFHFDSPGDYVIVGRATRNSFNTPWSPPVTVTAVAPFDLERVSFPDARGPSYKVRGQIRERVARGKVTVYWAKGKKRHRFHKVGKAKINSKGRFTKRFKLRHAGVYRLRFTYKGSSLVAGGRVTQQIRIRRHVFFG